MKIDISRLSPFLAKATLNNAIVTAAVHIENGRMWAYNRSIDNTVAAYATLNAVDGENQSWYIKDMRMFSQLLNLFTGVVEIQINKNKLSIFNATKQVDYVLSDADFVDNALTTTTKGTWEATVTMPSDVFRSIVKNKKIVDSTKTQFRVEEGKLYITTGGKSFDTVTDTIATTLPNAVVHLGDAVNDVLSCLENTVEFGMKTDYPVMFKMVTPEYSVQYVAAPLQVSDD